MEHTIQWSTEWLRPYPVTFAISVIDKSGSAFKQLFTFEDSIVGKWVSEYVGSNLTVYQDGGVFDQMRIVFDQMRIPPSWSADKLISESNRLWEPGRNSQRLPKLRFTIDNDSSLTITNLNRDLVPYATLYYESRVICQVRLSDEHAHFLRNDSKAFSQSMTALQCAWLVGEWYSPDVDQRASFAFDLGVMDRNEQTFDWDYSGSVKRIMCVNNFEIPTQILKFTGWLKQAMVDLTDEVASLHDPRLGFPTKRLRRIAS